MLNFDVTKKCLVGEGWCPIFAKSQVSNYTFLSIVVAIPFFFFRTKALEDVSYFDPAFQIKDCLQRATFHSNSQVGIIFHEMDTLESPPTYFRTDKFTNAFQEIVDAYGYVQRCQSQHESEILPLFQIMSRYITKTMHLEMPKRPIIWNGGSTCSDSFIFYLPH